MKSEKVEFGSPRMAELLASAVNDGGMTSVLFIHDETCPVGAATWDASKCTCTPEVRVTRFTDA